MGGRHTDPRYAATARGRVPRGRQLRAGRRDVLLRVDGDGAGGRGRLRPGSDRDARRRRAPFPGGGRAPTRGGEVLAEAPDAAPPAARTSTPRGGHRRATARMGRHIETTGIEELLYATRSTRVGTTWPAAAWPAPTARWCARPASAPRWRRPPTWPATAPNAGGRLGLVLHPRLLLPARGGRPGVEPRAVPAVDDPQAGHLDRPVRDVRLRRLRSLHHVVPGRDRHHRGGPRHQGRRRRPHRERA